MMMEPRIFRVIFTDRDTLKSIDIRVKQLKRNALNAAVAKYYREQRSRDFSKLELAKQIKYQITWLNRNPSRYRIIEIKS